jgi:hypothetical protein
VRPLYLDPIWSSSSIQYNLRGLFAKTVFDEREVTDTMDKPIWNWEFSQWSNERIDSHSVTARLEASVMDRAQSLSVTTVLPPKAPQISETAAFRFWISETTIRNTILEPFDSEKRKVQPIFLNQSFRFNSNVSFEQYLAFDPEIMEFATLTSSLRLWDFNARYQMSYNTPYRLNYNRIPYPSMPAGWIQVGDRSLQPQELSLSYSKATPKVNFWNGRLSFSNRVNSALNFDLQRYTYSRFTLGYEMALEISKFLELTFSATTENTQMYKYFQGLPFFTTSVPLPPGLQTNIFMDLFNSFRFDNNDLRRESAFKLKSFSLNLVHYLGDWNATLGMTLSPYLDTSSGSIPSWKFNNQISFLVRWVPIEEIRSEIVRNKDSINYN